MKKVNDEKKKDKKWKWKQGKINDDGKEQLRKCKKKGKKVMLDNLNDIKNNI